MTTDPSGRAARGAAYDEPPGSTYRVQLRAEFGFDDLAAQVDYLAALGVDCVYLSPILQAAPGSAHGYDVVDPGTLSADLGGAAGFQRLRRELERQGLRAVADVVPNHLAVPVPAHLNRAWWSVLTGGPDSPCAHWFDVDWDLGGGRLLVPVLGRPLADCLRDGELSVEPDGGPDGEPVARYYDHVLPLRPGSYDASTPPATLLDRQWWRLAFWRSADEELNYRRFFDVDTLAGVRVEDEKVFAQTSATLVGLVADGALTGLRIDHPDGLADPRGYLRRLADATGGAWVVVEKILEGEEQLPADWPCAGTTGYDAVRRIGGVFLDPAGEEPLTTLYTELTGEPADFAPVVERAKRDVVERSLQAEVRRLTEVLVRMTCSDVLLRDHPRRALQEALVELLVAFPVYRAYVVPGEQPSPDSVRVLEDAADRARQVLPAHRHPTVDLVRDLALDRPVGQGGGSADRDEFVVRFQQTCGPVMAKGVEDTAFYRWFRLAALNEVGGDPAHFGVDVAALHAWCAGMQRDRPGGLTTLSTHDTKRSEDVRARLAVLAELPEEWGRAVTAWRAAASAYRPELLDANTEYLLWQTLVGGWPLDGDRLTAYLEKATREAKRHTSWTDPDPAYDAAVRDFTRAVLADSTLMLQVEGFVARLAPHFRANVLGQKLLQLTVPGVPDVYQGSELVDLSLVDPDNRRAVDYVRRRGVLERVDAGTLDGRDGLDGEKLLVTSRALRLRREHPQWYAGPGASYQALAVDTPHAVAFVRADSAVTVVTRLSAALARSNGWGEATVTLPSGSWTSVLDGRDFGAGSVRLAELLDGLPVALLERR